MSFEITNFAIFSFLIAISLLPNSNIQNVLAADNATVLKTGIGVATLALFGIFFARIINNTNFSFTNPRS